MNGSYGFGNAGKRARFLRVKKLPAGSTRERERERARGSGESEIVVVLCEVARWWCSECPVESCGESGSGGRGGDQQQQQLRPIVYLSVTVVEPRSSSKVPPTTHQNDIHVV